MIFIQIHGLKNTYMLKVPAFMFPVPLPFKCRLINSNVYLAPPSISNLKWPKQRSHFSTPPPNLSSPSQQCEPHCSILLAHQPWCPGFLFLLHSIFYLLANLDGKTLKIYLIISNYLHDHFCLWTIYYQAVAIENYTSHFFTYLQNILQWLLSWLGIQSER